MLKVLRFAATTPARFAFTPTVRRFASRKAMEAHQVVPDVISVAPKALVTVKYPSGVDVSEGNVSWSMGPIGIFIPMVMDLSSSGADSHPSQGHSGCAMAGQGEHLLHRLHD